MDSLVKLDRAAAGFPFEGEAALLAPIQRALKQVVDPEVSLSIVDMGLVYAVSASAQSVAVRMTMTSAACPVTELILADVHNELELELPPGCAVSVEVCWEPPWSPDMISEHARRWLDG